MDSQTTLNIVTICISTILSIGAIILSIWFYRESNKQNKETTIMQTNIKNAVDRLNELYDGTYTDTFEALKTQLDAMQKHIFTSSVGETNIGEPNNLRFYVIGCITERLQLSIDDLCLEIKGYKKAEITETVYSIHREGIIDFDGNQIRYTKIESNISVVGEQEN